MLPTVHLKSKALAELASLTRTRDTLVKQRTALKNQVNNLFAASGVKLRRERMSSLKALSEVEREASELMPVAEALEVEVLVGQIRAIKEEFLLGLIRRSRTKKGYFQPLLQSFKKTHGSGDSGGEQEAADAVRGRAKNRGGRQGGGDALGVFLQITKLITDARAKVQDGLIDRETYDLHMQTIADMARLSLLTTK